MLLDYALELEYNRRDIKEPLRRYNQARLISE